jgi:hypothetical protein
MGVFHLLGSSNYWGLNGPLNRLRKNAFSWPLRRTRLAFPRRIPGLKSETWGTLHVSKAGSVWDAQGLGIRRRQV